MRPGKKKEKGRRIEDLLQCSAMGLTVHSMGQGPNLTYMPTIVKVIPCAVEPWLHAAFQMRGPIRV